MVRRSEACIQLSRIPGLVQTPLLDHHILADDQSMRGHLPQPGQNAVDMFIGVDK